MALTAANFATAAAALAQGATVLATIDVAQAPVPGCEDYAHAYTVTVAQDGIDTTGRCRYITGSITEGPLDAVTAEGNYHAFELCTIVRITIIFN